MTILPANSIFEAIDSDPESWQICAPNSVIYAMPIIRSIVEKYTRSIFALLDKLSNIDITDSILFIIIINIIMPTIIETCTAISGRSSFRMTTKIAATTPMPTMFKISN